jgi:4'-phosphopantetheinyl transferase
MGMQPGARWLVQSVADVPGHYDWLARAELDVLEAKAIIKRRSEWLLGRWTAKKALLPHLQKHITILDYSEIEIRAAADGAPEVFIRESPAPVTISLSHSRGVALCAVAGRQEAIGCDTEYIEPHGEAFLHDYFAPPERDTVAGTTPAQQPLAATLIWSAKESVLKAMREGLRRDTRSVIIDVTPETTGDEWSVFRAHCETTGKKFDGWWRVSGTHVHSISRLRPGH